MDWLTFLEIMAVPAYGCLACALIWGYVDLRSMIRFNKNSADENHEKYDVRINSALTQIAAGQSELKAEMSKFQLEMMREYIPKQDVLRLETRIIEAIGKLEDKVDGLMAR